MRDVLPSIAIIEVEEGADDDGVGFEKGDVCQQKIET